MIRETKAAYCLITKSSSFHRRSITTLASNGRWPNMACTIFRLRCVSSILRHRIDLPLSKMLIYSPTHLFLLISKPTAIPQSSHLPRQYLPRICAIVFEAVSYPHMSQAGGPSVNSTATSSASRVAASIHDTLSSTSAMGPDGYDFGAHAISR